MFEKADAELAQAEVFSSIWRAKRPKNAVRIEVLPGRSGIELALRIIGRAKRPKNAVRFEVLPGRSGIELALRAFVRTGIQVEYEDENR